MSSRVERRAQAEDLHHLDAEQRANWPETLVGYIMQWAGAVDEVHNKLTNRKTARHGWNDNAWAGIHADAIRKLFRAVDLARRTTAGSIRGAIGKAVG